MKRTCRSGFCFDLLWCSCLVFMSVTVIYVLLIIGTSIVLKPKMIDIFNISSESVTKIEKINMMLVMPLYSSYIFSGEKEK